MFKKLKNEFAKNVMPWASLGSENIKNVKFSQLRIMKVNGFINLNVPCATRVVRLKTNSK